MASKPEQVCVCVCVHKSTRAWLDQQACPLLRAVIQRDPCIRSVVISKQSIAEAGSGKVSGAEIDGGSDKRLALAGLEATGDRLHHRALFLLLINLSFS